MPRRPITNAIDRNDPVEREFDFTKMRKGSRTHRGETVDYCPKCGRKGAKTTRSGGSCVFTHRSHMNNGTGFTFEIVDESCFVPKC